MKRKKDNTIYNPQIDRLKLSDLVNPQNIEGVLLWNRGNPLEIVKSEVQAFQEYPKSVELWQELEGNRIVRIQRWLKKSITHYVINNTFVAK